MSSTESKPKAAQLASIVGRETLTSSTSGTPSIPLRMPLVEGVTRRSGSLESLARPSGSAMPQKARLPLT
eukprot:scaffold8968_cov57-Phaeocystis_antarctica.AAC.2